MTGQPDPSRYMSRAAFNAGALICPAGEAERILTALAHRDDIEPGTASLVDAVGIYYLSSTPEERRRHKVVRTLCVDMEAWRPPAFVDEALIVATQPLSLFDGRGRSYGNVTPIDGPYKAFWTVNPATAPHGDEFYVPETWVLHLMRLDKNTHRPLEGYWWENPPRPASKQYFTEGGHEVWSTVDSFMGDLTDKVDRRQLNPFQIS